MMYRAAFAVMVVLTVSIADGFFPEPRVAVATDWRFILSRPASPRPISPWVYGVAAAPADTLRVMQVTLNRWGGNTASRYNWRLGNTWNAGSDWYFMNGAVEADAWEKFLERTWTSGAAAILTVPLVGYVARDARSYSFSIRKYGPQEGHAPENPDAGDGRLSGGRLLYGNDPRDANEAAGPAFMAEWMRAVVREFPDRVADRRLIVALGNEPMLWNRTHRDVHPEPVTYDEYLERYIATARTVRREIPQALLAGPELWGWPALFQSARDRDVPGGQDRLRHGGEPFLPWFLRQLRAYEVAHGECLLDVVTVHFYPQAEGVYSDAASLGHRLRRIATTRTLFDPGYEDPSWINERVALIPRLRKWIDENYPGRKLGITEYNWGGEKDISGAIALADILGTFGREGLDLACYWPYPPADAPAGRAYAIFRNVDGGGACFGTQGWDADWAGDGELHYEACSVYAAELPGERTLTIVAINKTRQAKPLRLRSASATWAFAEGYMYNETTANGIASLPIGERPTGGEWLTLILRPMTLYHLRFRLDQ